MPFFSPTYDGFEIFGTAVSVRHQPNPTAQQINAFFGIQGVQAVFGGARGRAFFISGLLAADDPLSLRGSHALLLSYADGVPRVLVDAYGYAWPNVIFKGEFQEGRLYFNPNGLGGVCQDYKAVFYGLT